jgi:hypothetical protein
LKQSWVSATVHSIGGGGRWIKKESRLFPAMAKSETKNSLDFERKMLNFARRKKSCEKPAKIIRVTYPYEDHAFWNKEKKRGEHKCKCTGRLGPDGKEVNNGYYHARK